MDHCYNNYRNNIIYYIKKNFKVFKSYFFALKVGYGDIYPTSVAGKIVAGFIICIGLCVIAIPIGVIGANFSDIFEKQKRKQRLIQKYKMKNKKISYF